MSEVKMTKHKMMIISIASCSCGWEDDPAEYEWQSEEAWHDHVHEEENGYE